MSSYSDLNYNPVSLALNFNTIGDNTIVAAATGQVLRIYALDLAGATATAISLKDGASTTVFGPSTRTLIELRRMPDNRPHFVLTSGNAFIINLGAGNAFGGLLIYSTGPA